MFPLEIVATRIATGMSGSLGWGTRPVSPTGAGLVSVSSVELLLDDSFAKSCRLFGAVVQHSTKFLIT